MFCIRPLKHMCFPCRYSDMVHLFAKLVPVISMITNEVLDHIYATHCHRIQQFIEKERHLITASRLWTGLFGPFLGQNETKESSTTGINVSTL